ncbi:PaaI family thioesterase [Pseudooceanicola sp.]|uniref:PaaI family thioesterase n=1 Tax=Pseudooceanicola sp. TaxID=1914328 RepID=UPI0026127215|nr:PaaI family thioesterase [Pseudooceanicola sp.]MDF1855616.1 PaaI family thioesterase [Pseudooceanicola sp.]
MKDDDSHAAGTDDGIYKLGGFNQLMGFRIVERGEGFLKGEIDLQPYHMNKAKFTHGGVYAAVLDSACTGSGLYCPYPGRIRKCSTLSLTVNYVGMSKSGKLHIESRVTRSGRTIYSSVGEVYDDQGNLCAHAIGTFKYMRGSDDPKGVPMDPE